MRDKELELFKRWFGWNNDKWIRSGYDGKTEIVICDTFDGPFCIAKNDHRLFHSLDDELSISLSDIRRLEKLNLLD